MDTLFDAFVSFPATSEYNLGTLDRLHKLLGAVEQIEIDFKIEFSCGDGKFFNDYWKWTEGAALIANYHTDEEYEEVAKYDGKVCYLSPPRFSDTNKIFKTNKDYRFTVKRKSIDDMNDECRFYINGRERSRRIFY